MYRRMFDCYCNDVFVYVNISMCIQVYLLLDPLFPLSRVNNDNQIPSCNFFFTSLFSKFLFSLFFDFITITNIFQPESPIVADPETLHPQDDSKIYAFKSRFAFLINKLILAKILDLCIIVCQTVF